MVVSQPISSTVEQKRDIYVGNVNPKCGVSDIRQHLHRNGVTVQISDVHRLHNGNDYASFRISVPERKYDALLKRDTGVWDSGLKIRPYLAKNQDNGQKNKTVYRKQKFTAPRHRQPNYKKSNGNKPTPQGKKSNPGANDWHQERMSGFQAGYDLAMQDARHHSWFPPALSSQPQQQSNFPMWFRSYQQI